MVYEKVGLDGSRMGKTSRDQHKNTDKTEKSRHRHRRKQEEMAYRSKSANMKGQKELQGDGSMGRLVHEMTWIGSLRSA